MSNNGLIYIRTEDEEYHLFSLTRDTIDCCEYAILCGNTVNPVLETTRVVLHEFLLKIRWGEMYPSDWVALESELARWKYGFIEGE